MTFFPTQGPLTQKQVDNIKKAIEYLLSLFDCCPDLGRDDDRVAIVQKLRELAANDDAIRDHFGVDDAFLNEHDSSGWTEKFLRIFWNRFILINTQQLPDQDLDPRDCADLCTLLELAMIMWHETNHWERSEDGWIQPEEIKFWQILAACRCIVENPCVVKLQMVITDYIKSAKKEDDWWTGAWNWIKENFGRLVAGGGTIGVLIAIVLFILGLAAGIALWEVMLIGLIIWLFWEGLTRFWPWVLSCGWTIASNTVGGLWHGLHITGSAPANSGALGAPRTSPGIPNASDATGAPDGRTVALVGCQSIVLLMPKDIAWNYKLAPPGGLDDLKVTATGGQYEVEVGNSSIGPWKMCGTGSGTATFRVPFWGSPWKYVRIHALGPTQLDAVEGIYY